MREVFQMKRAYESPEFLTKKYAVLESVADLSIGIDNDVEADEGAL